MSRRHTPSRRDFLKGSSLAVTAAAAASLGVARSAHAAGNDELKVALIGCGGRGRGAANDCRGAGPNIKVVAVADAFENMARLAARMFNVPPERTFAGLDAYQKAIDCGVDVVVLASPPGFRPMHYEAAIKAGKHVFMEKPCCTDAPGFRKLMEANKLADDKNLRVVVGLQRRYSRDYLPRIQQLHEGAVGEVVLLRCYWNGSGVWVRPRQPGMTEMQYQVHNWYYFPWLSGDNIAEQHIHNLDICNWVMKDHPVEANGMGGRQVRKGKEVGCIFDHHFVEFTYKNGAKMYSQCRHQPGAWDAVTEAVHGTKGKMDLGGGGGDGYRKEHVALVNAIRNSQKLNDGWHGATSSMTAVLGRMATYSGRLVRWDDAVAKGPNELPEKLAWDAPPRQLPDKDGSYEHHVAVPGAYVPY